jgi:hypothetical protein
MITCALIPRRIQTSSTVSRIAKPSAESGTATNPSVLAEGWTRCQGESGDDSVRDLDASVDSIDTSLRLEGVQSNGLNTVGLAGFRFLLLIRRYIMRKYTFVFLSMLYMVSASADQASCNGDAKDTLNSCLQSTKDSNVKSSCLASYYAEVAKCAYLQKEENDRSKDE